MKDSTIEWTNATFNPWIGCTKVSAGCLNCYAEGLMDTRWGKVKWGPKGKRQRTSAAYWRQPLAWDREAKAAGERRRVFCASLADIFEDRPELVEWRCDLFTLILKTPNLDWLLLTKRPENIPDMLTEIRHGADDALPLWDMLPMPNVWFGTSVEDQENADKRIPELLKVPAIVRFLSAEPLLGPIDLTAYTPGMWRCLKCGFWMFNRHADADEDEADPCCSKCRSLNVEMEYLHQVITGCESLGSRAGRFQDGYETAARSILRQCDAADVAYFHKQMPINGRVSHDPKDWPNDLRVRKFPVVRQAAEVPA